MMIALATRNEGKIREIKRIFEGLDVELVDHRDLPPYDEPPEEGGTFLENALEKARAVHAATGLPALADDSGIEVEALDWGPGVRSARYGGEGLSDGERSERLLDELRGLARGERAARFRCVMVLYPAPGSKDEALTTEGFFHGEIALEPAGENGFGYDPIFYVPERGMTVAQMTAEEKNSTSHRYRAGLEMRYLLAERIESLQGRSGRDDDRLKEE